jgi:Gluconate 2-dehydrogenase subunit 3
MKRRGFVKSLIALPAVPALAAPQQAPAQTPAAQPPAGGRGGGAGGRFGQGNIPKFELTQAEVVGEPTQRFFTGPQFAALRKLSDVLMPPMRGFPGALDCGAPEFLDFLIGDSPADRKALYRNGLDALNAHAKKQFNKEFAELDTTQADAVIRPLLAPVPWAYDLPKDPTMHFLAEAHRDIRTATQNSREWAAAGASSGRRTGFGGGGSYLNPIDPVYKG